MKKDIDVNDCEPPPPHPTPTHTPTPTPPLHKKGEKERKIETSTELSKWQIRAPSVHAEHPAKIHVFVFVFLMKEENKEGFGGGKREEEGILFVLMRKI